MPKFIQDVEEIRQRAIRNIEEGAVTEAYELEPEKVVNILNEALATEIVCVLRYMHHYFMATGVHAKAVSAEFKEHADAEREHADEIAERIQQLGGKPDFNPRTLMERSAAQYVEGETLGDMIREDLIAERIVIDVYNQMIRYIGDKDPTTRVMLEHILGEEEEHASDLSDLLYIVEPSTGETEAIDPGVHPLQGRGEQGGGDQQRKARQSAQQSGGRAGRTNAASTQNTQSRSAESASDEEEGDDTDRFVGHIDRDEDEPRPMAQTIADREGGSPRGQSRGNAQSGSQQRGNQQTNQRSNQQTNQRGNQQASQRGNQQNSNRQNNPRAGQQTSRQEGNQRTSGGAQGISNRQDTQDLPARGNAREGATASGGRGTGANAPAAKNAGTTGTRGGSIDARRNEANATQGELRPSRATGSGRPDARTAKPAHEPGTTGRPRRNDVQATSIDRGDDGGMGGGTRAVRVTNKQRKNRAA
jgi:bacterioferritin